MATTLYFGSRSFFIALGSILAGGSFLRFRTCSL